MKRYLYENKNIDKIFNVFNKYKITIRRIFNVTNETVTFIKIM